MKTNKRRFTLLSLWLLASVLIIAGCTKDGVDELSNPAETGLRGEFNVEEKSGHASQNKLEASIRAATSKFHNFDAAVAAGYVLDPHCVEHPFLGGMGFHALRMDILFNGLVDPLTPEVLVYEPMKNGKLRLVAVEYLVVAEAWDPFNDGPPMLGNVEFNDHRPPGSGGPPFPHYQLHVWLWKNNPEGMYTPFNPNVNCEYAYFWEE